MLLNPDAEFPLAVRLRTSGVAIGDLFGFMSALYFRGKIAYGRHYGVRAAAAHGALVIVPGRGLVDPDTIITTRELREVATVGVSADNPRYREPLERDTARLASELSGDDIVVLLGSIATGKYVDVLEHLLDGRLRFPAEFVGRGDMSRGGLMLRCVCGRVPLTYVPIAGAVRRGTRPPRLERLERPTRDP
jgi:hypothetical protein